MTTKESDTAAPAALRCPRDGAPLRKDVESPDGCFCGTCKGLFLRNAATKAAFEAIGMNLEKSRLYTPVPTDCPGCGSRMKGIVVNWIALDLCDACQAVWLDQGEKEKVDEYVDAGRPRHRVPTRPSPEYRRGSAVSAGPGSPDVGPMRLDPALELADDLLRLLRDTLDGRR